MTDREIADNLTSIKWQGTLYPEQMQALLEAVVEYMPNEKTGSERMSYGEIARHLGRILAGKVMNTTEFRLTDEQQEALDQASKEFWQKEDDVNDYYKSKYD